jgi:aryl-alcohol dehydrogenase-like predicted oxidoreductase
MKFTRLGWSDLRVSVLCLGGMSFGSTEWMVKGNEAEKIIKTAIDGGINFIDTANVYSTGESEKIIGTTIKNLRIRDDLILCSKVGGKFNEVHQGFSRSEINYQLKGSLERLQTERLDIYTLHTWFDSLKTHSILRNLKQIVDDGKTSYIGVSNFLGYQLAEFYHAARETGTDTPVLVQNHYNAVYREDEREVIPYSSRKNIAYTPFSPLAAGFLTGKYRRGSTQDTARSRTYPAMKKRYFRSEDFDVLETVEEVARERGTKSSVISLAYVLAKGFIPVFGATKVEHVLDAIQATEISLGENDIKRIEEKYVPHPVSMGTAGY